MGRWVGFGAMSFVLSILANCGQSEPTPAQKAAAEVSRQRAAVKAEKAQAADERLMADAITAGPELQRRLRQKLQRSGRLLLLGGRTTQSNKFSIIAIPLSTPWAVKCSSPGGLAVTFGGWSSGEVSEGSGAITPDIVVALTDSHLTEERCVELVVLIGETLAEIVGSTGGPR
jgi:hypothetical protein